MTALGDVGVLLQTIQSAAQRQAEKTGGATQDKNKLKKAMCDKAHEIAALVLAYANKKKDKELAGQVRFTKSELLGTRDTEVAGLCKNVRQAATENLTSLADYAVTVADLTDLAQKISDYETAVQKPAEKRVDKKTATDEVKGAVDELMAVFEEQLDPLSAKFATLNPEFHTAYKNARVIVDNRGGSSKPTPTPPTPPTP